METISKLSLFVFFFSFVLIVPAFQANIGYLDEVLEGRKLESLRHARELFVTDTDDHIAEFNQHVRMALEGTNSTRRSLRKKHIGGRCLATNPIDRCWRCRPDWATDRKRLATCVKGFGRNTVGGKYGRIYVVTNPTDNDMVNPKPGTLRHAVIQKEPLWIIFARNMVITLKQELLVSSHKTIDGRGAQVHIAYGAGITVQFARNVIIHNLRIHDTISTSGGLIRDSVDHIGLRTTSDGDGVSVYGSTNVWIDHLSMSNCKDGLIDIIEGSTAITVSNNHMTRHNDVMLFGAHDDQPLDSIMQITVAFNHFGQGLIQRMPRCRWGFVHVVNNDYTHWIMYAIGGSHNPTIVSQGNRYIAPPNLAAKNVTHRIDAPESVWKDWTWVSEGDLLMNGAVFVPSGTPQNVKKYSRKDKIKVKPATYVTRLTRFAGALNCKVGKPC
ncbi:hypothetical protein MKW94_027885 [Papaver nudicaule]|uniref:Pectate lyase n=1 Tax=Papaver nudicaule TaxID=74823 RepID=A0AA41S2Y0_PAPNU|nr:hypothetical protein [Papaver nudicaule]